MKKPVIAIFLGLFATVFAPAQVTLDEFLAGLPAADKTALAAQGELTVSAAKIPDLKWWKVLPVAGDIQKLYGKFDASVAVEGLFVVPLASAENRPGLLLKLLNSLMKVSSMEGLMYYSVTRKDWEKLILASYRVEKNGSQAKLPDLDFTGLPGTYHLTIFQKDNKSGDGFTALDFAAFPDHLNLTLTNLTGIGYGPITLVEAGNSVTTFVAWPLKDHLVVYGIMGLKMGLFGAMGKEESFFNRMKALAGWALRDFKPAKPVQP